MIFRRKNNFFYFKKYNFDKIGNYLIVIKLLGKKVKKDESKYKDGIYYKIILDNFKHEINFVKIGFLYFKFLNFLIY